MCCWRDDIREIERRVKYLWPNQMRGRREPWQKQRNLDSNDPSFLVRFSPPCCGLLPLRLPSFIVRSKCMEFVGELSWLINVFVELYIYIYTQTKNNFRKEISRNDKFINFGKWYSYQKRKLYPFFDLNLNCFYFNATKIFESFLSFSLFLFYMINSDFKLYVEFRSDKVSVHSFHSFNIFFFSNYIVNQGALSRFHEDVEISGGNLSDKYEYVTVSKVWTLPHSCDWRLICTS